MRDIVDLIAKLVARHRRDSRRSSSTSTHFATRQRQDATPLDDPQHFGRTKRRYRPQTRQMGSIPDIENPAATIWRGEGTIEAGNDLAGEELKRNKSATRHPP